MNLDSVINLFVGRAFVQIGAGIDQLLAGKKVGPETRELLGLFAQECRPHAAMPGLGVMEMLGLEGKPAGEGEGEEGEVVEA
jgi:hypothetical protein